MKQTKNRPRLRMVNLVKRRNVVVPLQKGVGFAAALALTGIFSGTIVLVHRTAGFHASLVG